MKRIAKQSQYFLRNPRLVKELIGHTTIKKTDTVIDIGAGSGVITSVLASRCKKVVALETDPRMTNKLHENVQSLQNVIIVEKDFLKHDLPTEPYKVFANIPFHLSSPILKKLTESDHHPVAIYLIVQKQFANKLLIDDRRFTGMLGATIAPLYTTRIRKRLKTTDFWPHPAVDTVLMELLLRETPLIEQERLAAYRKFIKDCYDNSKKFEKMPRQQANIPVEAKPSQLTLQDWLRLFSLQKTY